jgi:hypothetical protein
LLAGLVTAIAGGAAAFAAADTAPSPAGPVSDPYLGSWALMLDGAYAGPVASVEDCDLQAEVVTQQVGPGEFVGKHAVPASQARCTIEVGLGMSPSFNDWLSGSLSGDDLRRARIRLVRTDTEPYALELGDAKLTSVTLPKIDRASTRPAFLELGLEGEIVRRTPASKVAAEPVPGFAPARLAVHIDGVSTDVATVGPWKAQVPRASGELEDNPLTDIGNLPLRVSEGDATRAMDPWLQSSLVEGRTDERSVTLTLTDGRKGQLDLKFGHAGPAGGDLSARADGNRGYTLYAERVNAVPR